MATTTTKTMTVDTYLVTNIRENTDSATPVIIKAIKASQARLNKNSERE
jgi:hypothetical protein